MRFLPLFLIVLSVQCIVTGLMYDDFSDWSMSRWILNGAIKVLSSALVALFIIRD